MMQRCRGVVLVPVVAIVAANIAERRTMLAMYSRTLPCAAQQWTHVGESLDTLYSVSSYFVLKLLLN